MQRIKSVGVLSVAKISGVCYAAMALLFIPFFILFAVVSSVASKQTGNPGIPPVVGVIFAICAPFIYGAMGFVMGALGAFVYNLASGWIGGIELNLEIVNPASVSVQPQP